MAPPIIDPRYRDGENNPPEAPEPNVNEVASIFATKRSNNSDSPIFPESAAFIPSKPPPKTPYRTNENPIKPVKSPPIAGL